MGYIRSSRFSMVQFNKVDRKCDQVADKIVGKYQTPKVLSGRTKINNLESRDMEKESLVKYLNREAKEQKLQSCLEVPQYIDCDTHILLFFFLLQ